MQPANRARIFRLLRSQWALFVLLLAVVLSGCVNAELGINFKGQTGGEIVQHIKLADPLTTFNGATTQEWFDKIKQRTRQLQGKAKQVSAQEIAVTIPFSSGTDLEAKLNQFLSDEFTSGQPTNTNAQLEPLLQSHLTVTQQNFLLLVRHHLSFDLDLRSLGIQSLQGNLLLSPEALVKLEFSLSTPWGARSLSMGKDVNTGPRQQIGPLVWTLQPGQLNHLEAAFWFPSPLGVGAVVIALFVAAGTYLKYGLFAPAPTSYALPNS